MAHNWFCFYLLYIFRLPNILMFLGKLDVKWSRNINAAVSLFRQICNFFGRAVTNAKIKPLFVSSMAVPKEIVSHLGGLARNSL